MPLFHPRIIEKHTKNAKAPSPEHVALLTSWAENLANGIYDSETKILTSWAENLANGIYDSETKNDGQFIQRILVDLLGYKESHTGSPWTAQKNQPVGKGNVDVALGSFTADSAQIIAPFELKGAKTKDLDAIMAGRNKSPVQQAWEYAMDAKSAKWVLVSNYREIRLYSYTGGRKDYESFNLSTLTDTANYARFMLLLSADNLLGGNTANLLLESEQKEKEITNRLYEDYKLLRAQLVAELSKDNPATPIIEIIHFAQTILDRVLFVAFAEDKGLLPKETLKKAYEAQNQFAPQPVWENFKGLFTAIDKGSPPLNITGYNGGLFADNPTLNALNVSNSLCEGFKKIGDYDFESDVSVNILGHIFEQSITDLEELKAQATGDAETFDKKKSKRKKDGVFYTPPYITRYIVEQAVGGWLNDRKQEIGFDKLPILEESDYASIESTTRGKNKGTITYNKKIEKHIKAWEAYRQALSGIKVLDPACGSGAFLNEVFDFLYREGQTVNRELTTLNGGQAQLFRWDKHILANNIYGVDINRESVEITKLSLWLKTANKNEKLTYLDDNIKCGNSLIDDPAIAGDLAFNWNERFAPITDTGGFDVVVGNPPYIDSEEMSRNGQQRDRDFIVKHYTTTRGNWDIYIAFFEFGLRAIKPNGVLAYITPDKWLSKPFGIELRKQILPYIKSILFLGRDVFESALVDSIITIIRKTETETLSMLRYDAPEPITQNVVLKKSIPEPYAYDELLSSNLALVRKIEDGKKIPLKSIAECENACATSDTYLLKEFISDFAGTFDTNTNYKLANTGTLDRYVFRWGLRSMRYLKNDYLRPIVSKADFNSHFGASYIRRASKKKLIIKGLTLLDASIDLEGEYIPGKSTLVICCDNEHQLKFLAAFINSKLPFFYISQKYSSSSYNGGIGFTKDMLNSIPMPKIIDFEAFSKKTDLLLKELTLITKVSSSFLSLLKAETGIDKPSTKLEYWYVLSFPNFVSELKKKGVNLTVGQKAEWMEHFEKQKAEALALKNTIDSTDREIDQMVYALYGLTAEEIAIIES